MTTTRITTGILMIAAPLTFALGFTALQMTFDYPDILRQPGGEVLTRFAAGGTALRLWWYLMFASALGLIPAALGIAFSRLRAGDVAAALVATFGVLAGLTQALGLLRWVMLVPMLADNYLAPGASELDKALAVSTFDAANHYLGMGVGEHLGYFFTTCFTLVLVWLLAQRSRFMAITGLVAAFGVIAGMAEPFGVPYAGLVNAIGYSLWALWAIAVGVLLLLWRKTA